MRDKPPVHQWTVLEQMASDGRSHFFQYRCERCRLRTMNGKRLPHSRVRVCVA